MEHHRILDRELTIMHDQLQKLGAATETAVHRAMYSLTARDDNAANEVLKGDDAIDQLEIELDRMCIDVFVLRQPAARDLRFVISVAKVTPILERIADHACNIARSALDLNNKPELKPLVDLPRMAEIAGEMLRSALDAFTEGDAKKARETIMRDDEIDELHHRIFQDLIEIMISNPSVTARATHLLFVSKHLERIGDYVTDICELTVYMAEAAFIKHSNPK